MKTTLRIAFESAGQFWVNGFQIDDITSDNETIEAYDPDGNDITILMTEAAWNQEIDLEDGAGYFNDAEGKQYECGFYVTIPLREQDLFKAP